MQLALLIALSAPSLLFAGCRGREQASPQPDTVVIAESYVQRAMKPDGGPKGRRADDDVVKYDDVEWHQDNTRQAHLPDENAATPMGIFIAWAVMQDLVAKGDEAERAAVKRRAMTGTEFLGLCCVDKLFSTDLSPEGAAFAGAYYRDGFFEDYDRTLTKGLPSRYHVPNTWEGYDKLATVLDRRFKAWKARRRGPH